MIKIEYPVVLYHPTNQISFQKELNSEAKSIEFKSIEDRDFVYKIILDRDLYCSLKIKELKDHIKLLEKIIEDNSPKDEY